MCALVTGVQTCALPISIVSCAGSPTCAKRSTSRSRRWRLRCAAKPPFGRWLTNVVRGSRGRAVGGNEAQLQATPRQRSEHQIRSEEHTSELQSLMRTSYAVFCLKQKKHNHISSTQQK